MTEKDNLIEDIIEGIRDRKGRSITHVDMSVVPGAAVGHFVICEGTSSQHVASIADRLEEYVLEHSHVKPFNHGNHRADSRWIVLDYGDTFVHIFAPETRQHYDLEELWSDARITNIPDLD